MALRLLRREELIDEIRRFMSRIAVRQAILYGSRAKGTNLGDSDVDLMVISRRFEGTVPHQRLAALHHAWDPSLPFLEALAYTPEEFEEARKQIGIERIADREGIRIMADEESYEAT